MGNTENWFQLKTHLKRYEDLEFCVIPLLHPSNGDGKRPALTEWTTYQKRKSTNIEHKMWFEYSDVARNIGIVTGTISGNLIVLDLDDMDTYNMVSKTVLNDTMRVRTGKGVHLYYWLPHNETRRTVTFKLNGKLHHIKAENSYVVAAPSLHQSGAVYTIDDIEDSPAFLNDVDDLKEVIKELGGEFTSDEQSYKERPSNWASSLMETTPQGERNTRAAQLCGLLIAKFRYDPGLIAGLMSAWNNTYCHPPLSEKELSTLIEGEYRRYGPK